MMAKSSAMRSLTEKQKEQVKRTAKRVINRKFETKYINSVQYIAIQFNSTTPILRAIGLPPQGTTDFQRIGDKITIKRFRFRLQLYRNQVAAGVGVQSPNAVRFIMFQWKPNSVPVITDVLQGSSIYSFYNWDNKSEYKVLLDRTAAFSQNGNAESWIKKTLYKMNTFMAFQNGSATISTNIIYYMLLNDNGSTDTNQIGYSFSGRLEYTDA